MKTEELPEIIEIIDDGLDPFGDTGQRNSSHDTGGPRWVGPVAAVALVALIGLGVATSTSSTSAPKAAPVPTTTVVAPATTLPAPATTTAQLLVPYYAADPPRYLTVQYAEYEQVDRSYLAAGGYQLWATPRSTASAGRWFSMQSLRTGPTRVSGSNAYRVQAGDQSMTISHETTGQSSIQFSVNEVMSLSITSFGFNDEELVRLAQSVTMDEDSTEGDEVRLSDPSLIAGFRMISTVHPWTAVQGSTVEQIYYAASSNSIDGFTITVGPRSSADLAGSDRYRIIALRYLLDHSTSFEVNGHSAVAGTIVGQPDQAFATWAELDHVVSVFAPMPVPQLISVAQTVHQVSSAEWEGMRFQAAASDHEHGTDFEQTAAAPVSSGTDGDGEPWTIRVGATTFANRQEIDWDWGGRGFASFKDGTARINTDVDGTRTYVLAELPRALASTAHLLIARTDRELVSLQFVDVDPAFDQTFAAYAFSEPGPYVAHIVGADGALLASWPSS